MADASSWAGQVLIMTCQFCHKIARGEYTASNESAVAFADAYPVGPGHTLAVIRRHEGSVLNLLPVEQEELWRLVGEVTHDLQDKLHPDGVNIGVNVGRAAGQTVGHAHVHIIPRFRGDCDDPRGGIRWVLPENAAYW